MKKEKNWVSLGFWSLDQIPVLAPAGVHALPSRILRMPLDVVPLISEPGSNVRSMGSRACKILEHKKNFVLKPMVFQTKMM